MSVPPRLIVRLFASAAYIAVCAPVYAQPQDSGILTIGEQDAAMPVRIDADTISYSSAADTVTAEGSAEIHRGADIIIAERVIYERSLNIIRAEGAVNWLRGEDGTVITAETAIINNVTKNGTIVNIQAEFTDTSTLNAASAERKDGTIIAKDVSYTPCPLCVGDTQISPPWRVTADKAVIDETAETVRYNNVFFRVKDTPVMYLPYFAHPSPGAKRKSGLLTPTYQNDSVFGLTVEAPYYYSIKPEADIVVTPVYSSEEGAAMHATYRELTRTGAYTLTASGAYPHQVDDSGVRVDGREFRGHIEGSGAFELNRNWQAGFNAKRASDDTYIRRYGYGNEDVLTSRGYARFLTRNSWTEAQAISFQSLDAADDPAKTPLILPEIRYSWNGDNGYLLPHTSFSLDGGALALTRDIGTSNSRLTATLGSRTPWTAGGHVMAFETAVRTDGYLIDTDPVPGSGVAGSNEQIFRIVPEASLRWSYPLVRYEAGRSYTLEPTAIFTLSPNGGNPDEIPNEDSQDVEFTASNLFASNRFSGYDRIETGTRFAYGLKAGVTDDILGSASLTVGQNRRLRENTDFDALSGLRDQQSDYVVRTSYRKNAGQAIDLHLDYETRLDAEEIGINSQALYAALNVRKVAASVEYLSTDDLYENEDELLTSREAFITRLSVPVPRAEFWTASFTGHHDLGNSRWVSARGELDYDGECYGLNLSLNREFTRDRDIEPATTFAVKVRLKNFSQ